MLRTMYRLYFENKQISSKIIDVLNKDNGVAKKLFKADRKKNIFKNYIIWL